ncbi:hypothetical protein ACFWOX_24135 [Streptomyces sp. NPDC058467]
MVSEPGLLGQVLGPISYRDGPYRGIASKLTDAELVTLAMM